MKNPKVEQAEFVFDWWMEAPHWKECKTCITCGAGGLHTEQRSGRLVLMQGTEIHKCPVTKTVYLS